MSQLLNALSALGSHLWILIVAHFQVAYYLALLIATPAMMVGQAAEPIVGPAWANLAGMGLSWATFLGAYSFVRRGGLNPLMRRLWPGRTWDGAWWEWNWASALASLARRRRGRGATPALAESAEAAD